MLNGARRAPSISDVAAYAGVSLGTVSNVLNRPDKVTEATILKVRYAIEALGYVRNSHASSLAAGSSRNIGLVVIDISNSMFVDAARGAQAVAEAANMKVLLAGSEDDFERQGANIDFFDEARVAGLLLAPMQDSTAQIERFTAHGRPVVLLNFDPGRDDLCCAIVDNEHAGYLAAQHLIELGRRRIAFVGGDEQLQPIHLRHQGAQRAVDAASGVTFEHIPIPNLTPPEGIRVADVLADLPVGERPDAIIAVTDLLAAAIIDRLLERGLAIPGDIAVMGSDHNSTAWGGSVPMSTITMRGFEIGMEAMRLLQDEIARGGDGHVHERVVLRPELQARESTLGRG